MAGVFRRYNIADDFLIQLIDYEKIIYFICAFLYACSQRARCRQVCYIQPEHEDEDCDCKWIPVSYNGHIGYVSTKYLSKYKVKANKAVPLEPIRHYTNSRGRRVQSPTRYSNAPAGATALCRDGTYSFSQSRRGTCSHHGGVAKWLR